MHVKRKKSQISCNAPLRFSEPLELLIPGASSELREIKIVSLMCCKLMRRLLLNERKIIMICCTSLKNASSSSYLTVVELKCNFVHFHTSHILLRKA